MKVAGADGVSGGDYTSIAEREKVQEIMNSFSDPTIVHVIDSRRVMSVIPVYVLAKRTIPQG